MNDCCRTRLVSVKVAQHPNVYSDGSDNWEWLCGFWKWHCWFVSVGSLVRNSNKQPLCLCNTISICHEEYSPQEYDVLFTKWPQWNKLRCTCHMEILKKGPIKKKEKPMRHKFTLLREWTWSPTTSLRPKFKYPKPFLLWKIQAFYQNIMSFQ